MGDIAHHYMIYNMKFWCVRQNFRYRGELLRKPQNLHYLHIERRKTAKIKKKYTFFALFLSKYFAGIEKSYNFALAFQG